MGTNYIAPIWRMPKNANKDKLSNYSINFSGSNAFVNCGNITELNGASKLTFNLWIKYDSTLNFQVILGENITSSSTDVFQVYNWASGILYFWIKTGGVGTVSYVSNFSSLVNIDEWHMLTAVYDGTQASNNDRLSIYLDGGSTNIITNYGTIPTTYPNITDDFLIGKGISGVFNGKLSQICIFDYALSTDQINYLYNLNNPMVITGAEPVTYWPLGDNSNPNAPGSFPNISVGADSVFDFIPNDYINLGEDVVPATPAWTSLTVSAWVKKDATGSYGRVIGKDDGGSNRVFLLQVQNNDKLSGSIRTTSGGSWNNVQTTTNVAIGEWQHVAMTYTANGLIRLYINGQIEASGSTTIANLNTVTTDTLIGAKGNITNMFDGQISNVQIWDAELSPTEMIEVYNNGQPLMTGAQPQEANLKAWYKLNQTANWEADTAGNWQIPDAVSAYPQSFDFDGSSQIINLGNDASLYPQTGDMSYSFWVNPDVLSGYQTIYGFVGMSTSVKGVNINLFGSEVRVFMGVGVGGQWGVNTGGGTGGAALTTSSSGLTVGQWTHVAVTLDRDGNGVIYINGVANVTAAMNPNDYSAVDIVLSSDILIGNGNGYLNGKTSNLQVWNSNLSSSQVETLYNNGTPLTTAIATDNLKAWYKLNNTEFYDTFNATNKWMINNNGLSTNFNKCFWMNPLAIQVPSTLGYQDGTNAFSGAAWVNISSGNPHIISRQRGRISSTGAYPGWSLKTIGSGAAQGDPCFELYTNGNGSINVKSLSYTLQDGLWHFVAFTYDGSQDVSGVKLYVDGYEDTNRQVLANNMTGTIPDYNTPFMIGGTYRQGNFNNGRTGSNQFMSNAMYFESELSASDILTLYNNGVPLDDLSSFTTLKGWWKLDDTATYGSEWTIPDASGNGNTGTSDSTMPLTNRVNLIPTISNGLSSGMTEQNLVNNNVSALNGESVGMNTTNLVTSNISRTQPYSNYSFNFDAAQSDYFDCGDSDTFSFGNGTTDTAFSLSGWVYPDSNTRFKMLAKMDSSSQWEYQFGTNSTGRLSFTLYSLNTSDRIQRRYNSLAVVSGVWQHWVATYDGSASPSGIKIYINGVRVDDTTSTKGSYVAMQNTTSPLKIGTSDLSYFANGKVSNISIFNNELTQDDIINLYNNGITQDLSNFRITPIAWWPMDAHSSYYDGTDWVVRDLINGNDGDGANTGNVDDLVGNAPGSEASGTGTNLTIADLKGDMKDSKNNAYSINMGDYADGVTNPANSGRSTDTP